MAVKQVLPANLGPEFLIGTETPNKITVAVASPLKKDATGQLTIDPAALAALISAAETTTVLSYASATGILSYLDEDGGIATVNLVSVVQAVETTTTLAYAPTTGILSYTNEDGMVNAIDLPLENVLTSPNYDAVTNKLSFKKPDNSILEINLTDLFDIYALTAGNGIAVTGNGSTVTPWVVAAKVDPAPGNALVSTPTGLMVTKSLPNVEVQDAFGITQYYAFSTNT
jgi:hypothetical protein